jgi:hypothetical protein
VTTKNEVTLEFHQNDDAAVSLYEMRFHVPNAMDAVEETENSQEDAVVVRRRGGEGKNNRARQAV